jgi:hypothetical protein
VRAVVDGVSVGAHSGQVRWRSRPVIAAALRTVIVVTPLVIGYLATLVCLRLLRTEIAATRWWLLLAAAVSVLVCVGVERLTRRLLPLAALLKLSMLFPDRAPSRFKVARHAVSVKSLAARAAAQPSQDAASSAEQALALITALTAHDRRTRGHSERVRVFTDLLAEQVHLPREARDKLRWSSLLHDIGKLQVAVDILNKPTKLNGSEWDLVAAHPTTGEQLLGPLVAWLGEWGGAVRQHHEKFDGTGYPDGASGTDICRAARIVAIADCYEVMTAHRAYKKPMATIAARAELTRCAGAQFDPGYVRAFLAISLPRLLWAMGPASLLMNLPLMRALADTANKGVLATSQGGVLAASTVAVISGVAGTTIGHGQAPGHGPARLASTGRHTATGQASPGVPKRNSTAPILSVIRHPVGLPNPAPTITALTPINVPSSLPASTTTLISTTPQPTPPPKLPPPGVAFKWVPFPLIATRSASVGFTASASAAQVLCSLDGRAATVCTGSSVAYSNLSDGKHLVAVWAQDRTGRSGPRISTAFTVDTHGSSVTWTSTPPNHVASNTVTLAFTAEDPKATAWCSIDGASATPCGNPLVLNGLADGMHAVSVHTINTLGNVGPAIQTTFTVDTTAPTVTLTGTTISMNTASLRFTVDDPSATAWCSLDGSLAAACTTPVTYTGLPDGTHTVDIYAVDAGGNVGPTARASFAVDTTPPTITSISAPTAPVPSKSVSIPFTVDDPLATTWCSLDGATPAMCSSPVFYNNLSDATHSIAIYAIDAAGNRGPTETATFLVSADAPTVTLDTVPAQRSNDSTGMAAFSVDDPTADAWCSLDGAPATPCTSPVSYPGLSDGVHTIAVFASSLGNVQGGTVSTTFTVDTQPPTLTITSAPVGAVRSGNANLAYSIDDPTASAWCSIDAGPIASCSNPVDLSGLPEGAHAVTLYATDPAGNTGPSSQASFIIDNTAPVATLITSPPANSANRIASVGFTTNDATATAWCGLDLNPPKLCSSSATFTGLADGSHTISVYAIDAAGNVGPTTSTTFTVSAAAPTLITTPPSKSSAKVVTFIWLANPALTYQYSYDGFTWATTTTLISNTGALKGGIYTFHLRGIDGNGVTTAVSTFTFQVT